ncbi:hemin uptake protein HemP [Rhabdaerophilum sp. SD176]|uniref:hemin uptake protein HemP n=1 Tax=Rhabdaerophilum sp. SD176 TaxID=2983548 RepID=UPI0024E008BD|nr:hemin uptake protein HemP [Rhabdaerophilum sp. SD176]
MTQNLLESHPAERAGAAPRRDPLPVDPVSGLGLVNVADLLGAEREAILLHNGDRYRLRITANNRLILTK